MRRLGAFLLAIMGCLVFWAFSPTDGVRKTCGDGFSPRAADGSPDAAHAGGPAPDSPIPPEAIRIRILAHSDRPDDQAIKERVRDRVMALIGSWRPSPETAEEMRERLAAHLEEIERAAEAELARQDAPYGARAAFGRVPFPARTFAGREYPAGEYEALLIVLGDGEGENWWCVLFPPLCLAGAVAKDDETGSKGDDGQKAEEAESGAEARAPGQAGKTGAANRAARPVPDGLANGKAGAANGEAGSANGNAVSAMGKAGSANGKTVSAEEPERGPAQRSGDAGQDPAKPKVKFLVWELIQRLAGFLKNLFAR